MAAIPSFPSLCRYQYSCDDPAYQFDVFNPATGKKITTIQAGNKHSVHKAVEVAQEAFESDWRHWPAIERAAILNKCADKLEVHAEELAAILCTENGKPYQDALSFDVRFLVGIFRYFAALIDKIPDQFYDRGQFYVSVVREPHGVCAGILPFNWPPIHCGGKTAPALACGNTMILKPGEQAPLTVMRIVEILQTVLPPGVLQAVPGIGPEVPQALVEHSTVKMVSFTGSTASGKAVSKTAAPFLKPLALELGGKNAMLIFDDADLDRAVRSALEGAFFNKGEACTASSRILVQASLYDAFVDKMSTAVQKLRPGDGMKPDTHVGPCVSRTQQQKVLAWIDSARNEGAKVVAQAKLPDDPELRDGYFVPPTLIVDVTRDMAIAKEEVFGPVLTVGRFEMEDEAVSIANEVAYGLVASVFSKDSERALRVCRRLEAGMVFMNNYARNVLGIPFGGVKDSGYGREHSIETLKEWSSTKFIQIPSGRGPPVETPAWRAVKEILDD